MCTRSMNRGCLWVVCFEVLIFSPFVPNTVEHGICCLPCGEGCFSPNAKLVPWQVFQPPEDKSGSKEPASVELARGCTGFAGSWQRIPAGVIEAYGGEMYPSARQKMPS